MRERLVVSVFLAILVHFILLLVFQLVLKLERTRIPDYTGPLYITLGETPDEAPVIEKQEEPRQLPPMEREQSRVEQSSAEQAQGNVSSSLPLLRPAPSPETTRESTTRPRTGLRFLDQPETPSSDERYLPPEQEAYQSPPAQTRAPREPTPAEGLPVPGRSEVKPEEESEQPSVLDLRSLDSSLTQSDDAGTRSGTQEGGPAAQPTTGAQSTSAQEGRDYNIQWDDPSQGRDPTQKQNPKIPAWVKELGQRLQVVVSFELTAQGVLRNVKVVQGSGYSEVDVAVQDALRGWRFQPVAFTTRTVTGRITYTIIPD